MSVMSGSCDVAAGPEAFVATRGDAVALPAGRSYAVTARDAAYVLTATDAPLMSALGWLRPVPEQPRF